MKLLLRALLLTILCFVFVGMAKKKNVAVRFFVEANGEDTDRFSEPVKLLNPPRDIYIEKIPRITERQIRGIYPFQVGLDSWGATFQLEESGRLNLEVLSASMRGKLIVAYVGTDKGAHQVADMVIDRPIHDGYITIPHGLTEVEIGVLAKEFHLIRAREVGPSPRPNAENPTVPTEMNRRTTL
jgi:hypothetical protein